MTRSTSIDGAVALVTGAASGIGLALSAALVAKGAAVFMSDVDGPNLCRAAAGVPGVRGVVELDVRQPEAFAAVIEGVTQDEGRLDILVNNAGTAIVGETQDLSLEHWRRTLDVNLGGTVHGVLAVYPGMVRRRSGTIVNIASLAGLAPSPLFTAYSASKSGVVGLGLALRAEADAYGVNVLTVCPGVIETPLLDLPAPAGVRPPSSAPDPRSFLTRNVGPPYPAAALAEDIVRAVERNRAILVAPRRARLVWRVTRLSPALALAGASRAARRQREERESR
jgi:NAD(P)-dependent dehydrogenase (short-subunit alcohol dehydrogenase family)